jgi:hypothetical protein
LVGDVAGGEEAGIGETGPSADLRHDPPRPGQGVQVAQATGTLLDVGLDHLGDRTGALVPGVGRRGQRPEHPGPPLPGQGPALGPQLLGEGGVARHRPEVEHRRQRVEVGVGERERLLGGPGRLAEGEPGVPERVPEHPGRGTRLASTGTPGVQEHQVEVGARAQLASGVRAGTDHRPPPLQREGAGDVGEGRVTQVGEGAAERHALQ